MYIRPFTLSTCNLVEAQMKSQVTFNRKLSGSVFLILRIILDILILISILSRTYAVEVSLRVFLESVYLTILSPFIS